jgi:hypothetical protein
MRLEKFRNCAAEFKILHDPGAQPAVVLVFQDLREIEVVQGHMYLDSCSVGEVTI